MLLEAEDEKIKDEFLQGSKLLNWQSRVKDSPSAVIKYL